MVDAAFATLDEGHELIQLARQKHEDARAELERITATSVNPKVESSSAMLGQVVAALDGAVVIRDGGLDEFDRYLDLIGAKGSAGGRGNQGDQVTAPKLKRRDIEKEHTGNDDGDSTKSAFQRTMRGAVRNAGDLKKQTQSWAKAATSRERDVAPPGDGTTYTGVGHSEPPPGPMPADKPVPGDIFASIAITSAMIVEAVSRARRRKKEKDG